MIKISQESNVTDGNQGHGENSETQRQKRWVRPPTGEAIRNSLWSKAWCTLRAKSEANNRNMTSKQQRTGANILFLRYLFASLRYFAPSVHAP